MTDSNSAHSQSTASGRSMAWSSSRVVSQAGSQGAEVRIQSWAESASGETSHREKTVRIPGGQSVKASARASATDGEASTSCSID
jgi:hypothetical protein